MRRLQLLLSDQARTEEARASLVHALEALGCTITGVGAASVSIRVSDAVYCEVFDGPAAGTDAGMPAAPAPAPASKAASSPQAAFDAPAGLTIPPVLRPYLASVSEAPAHVALDRPTDALDRPAEALDRPTEALDRPAGAPARRQRRQSSKH